MPAPLHRRFSLRYVEDYLTHQIATRNLGLVDKSDIDYGLNFTSTVGWAQWLHFIGQFHILFLGNQSVHDRRAGICWIVDIRIACHEP
jgi:hypothetical protein